MNHLAHYQQMVEMALQAYNLPRQPNKLYESIEYILNLGGKRLRPVMVLMGCDFMGGATEKAVPAALSIEFFHNFSLMHDDIMDNADLRRGQPSVHKKWDLPTAILGGDALLVKAYQKLLETEVSDKMALLTIFNITALEVCEGQQLDMNFEERDDVSIDEYLEMIRLKTAVLMGASFKLGALTAKSDENSANNLYSFGVNLGMAFQLKDDYLDCFGEQAFGKVVGGDIIENKKTYLQIKTTELANAEQAHRLKQLATETNSNRKVTETKKLFVETGAKSATEEMMNAYYRKALGSLDDIQVSDQNKETLTSFAESVWKRQK